MEKKIFFLAIWLFVVGNLQAQVIITNNCFIHDSLNASLINLDLSGVSAVAYSGMDGTEFILILPVPM